MVRDINYRVWQPDLWVSLSDAGTLAYVPANVRARSLVLVDRSGQVVPFSNLPGHYTHVSLSRATGRIAVSSDYRVWIYDSNGSRQRLAPDNKDWGETLGAWTPDGRSVIYASSQSGNWDLFRRAIGGSTSEVLVGREFDQDAPAVSVDGTIAYWEDNPMTSYDIWLVTPDGEPRAWLAGPRNEGPGQFSPDGKWLAYQSDESGRYEIYVKPVDGNAPRVQVSTAGAYSSAWAPQGRTLFYQEAGAMWAVDLGRGDAPVLGARRKLFDGGWALSPFGEWDADFDVMPDGEHFLMIRHEPSAIPDRIHVVVNWFDELRRLVPVTR